MADQNDEGSGASSSSRGSGGGGAPPFADFSSFREMIREEREAARAEREAAAERARVEREAAFAEQKRLMIEVFELRLQLARGIERQPGVAGGEPWMTGSRGEPRNPIESAVQSGAAAGGDRITNPGGTATGLGGRMMALSGGTNRTSPLLERRGKRSRWQGNAATPSGMESSDFPETCARNARSVSCDGLGHSEACLSDL